jgi:hypothetical protein
MLCQHAYACCPDHVRQTQRQANAIAGIAQCLLPIMRQVYECSRTRKRKVQAELVHERSRQQP